MARLRPGAAARPERLLHDVRITRMGAGLDATGRIGDDGVRRTLDAILELLPLVRSWEPVAISAVGLEAFRRSANGVEVVRRIEEETGICVRILPGVEEARLGREAVVREMGPSPDGRPWLSLDIGGGSTELALSEPSWEVSIPLGAVVVTERYLRGDPPTVAEMEAMRRAARLAVRERWSRSGCGTTPRVVGVGGTVTTYAAILQELEPYDSARVHRYEMAVSAVAATTDRLAALPLAARRQVAGLHPERAPVILGGGALLEAVLQETEAGALVVSEANLLHAWLFHEAQRKESSSSHGNHSNHDY